MTERPLRRASSMPFLSPRSPSLVPVSTSSPWPVVDLLRRGADPAPNALIPTIEANGDAEHSSRAHITSLALPRTPTTSTDMSTVHTFQPGVGANTARGLSRVSTHLIDRIQVVAGYAWFWNFRRKGLDQKRLDKLSARKFHVLCGRLVELTRFVIESKIDPRVCFRLISRI